MTASPRLILFGGAALLLIALFLIPWVDLAAADEFTRRVEGTAGIIASTQVLEFGSVIAVPFHLDVLHDPSAFRAAYQSSPHHYFYDRAEAGADVMGRDLLFSGSLRRGLVLRVITTLSMALAIFTLILALPTPLNATSLYRNALTGLGGTAAVLLLLLVAYLPTVDNLGIYRDPPLATLLYLSKARTGWGVHTALLGVSAILVGVIASVATSPPPPIASKREQRASTIVRGPKRRKM